MTKRHKAMQHALGLNRMLQNAKRQRGITHFVFWGIGGRQEFRTRLDIRKMIRKVVRSVR